MLKSSDLGKAYSDGEAIFRQGDTDNRMYVVQTGCVELLMRTDKGESVIAKLGRKDSFGEMALFRKEPHAVTAIARGEARVLSIDKKGFLRRVYEDPSLAFTLLKKHSELIVRLHAEILGLKEQLAKKS